MLFLNHDVIKLHSRGLKERGLIKKEGGFFVGMGGRGIYDSF